MRTLRTVRIFLDTASKARASRGGTSTETLFLFLYAPSLSYKRARDLRRHRDARAADAQREVEGGVLLDAVVSEGAAWGRAISKQHVIRTK